MVASTWWYRFREQWELYNQTWDRVQRAQNPWEQEGPLRWARRYGRGWELHGATLECDGER